MEKEGTLKMPVIAVNDAMTNIFSTIDMGKDSQPGMELTGPRISLLQVKTLLLQVMVGAGAGLQCELQASEQCNSY